MPESEKKEVYANYGITSHAPGQYEVDHLISLELGGSNDIANLWPEPAEPRPGFHEKDKVENYLHEQVCSGAMPLRQAQEQIATNWLAVYERMSGSGATVAPPTPEATRPVAPRPTSSTATVASSGHTYYLSTYRTAHEYYCDDDPGWQRLSSTYLVHLSSEAEVHAQFPTYMLHRPC